MNKTTKIVSAIAIGLVALGGAGYAGANLFPVEKQVPTSVPGPTVYKNVTQTVEVPGPTVTVTKEVQVPVDNGKLAEVLGFLNDNYKNDDVFNSEAKIVERIDMYNLFEVAAKKEIQDNLIAELDNKNYLDSDFNDFRKSEVTVRRVVTPPSYVPSFDDKEIDYTFAVKVTGHSRDFNINDVTKVYNVTVDVVDDVAGISDITPA